MKPWTQRKQIASALRNEHVRIGERTLPTGDALRGVYATTDFAADDYVASYHGQIISREALFALHDSARERFQHINEYAVLAPSGGHLYQPDVASLGAHLINHSCGPNADWAHDEHSAVLVRAIKPIARGEEITIHYRWLGIAAAISKRWHPCACEAPFCTGTIELRVEMLDHGDGTGGPYLPPEEVSTRLLADIVNDARANESLLRQYARHSLDMIHGAEVRARLDPVAFADKLREGAHVAVLVAQRLLAAGRPISERRLRQIARTFEVRT